MSGKHAAVLVLAALVALPAAVAAQGLGDAAARERARREKETARGQKERTFSNDDLSGDKAAGDKSATGESKQTAGTYNAPASSRAPRSESNEGGAGNDDAAPEPPAPPPPRDLSGLEARVKALQDKLNPMSGSFIYGATGSGDAGEELRVRSELQQAEAELAQARQAAAAAAAQAGTRSPQDESGSIPQ